MEIRLLLCMSIICMVTKGELSYSNYIEDRLNSFEDELFNTKDRLKVMELINKDQGTRLTESEMRNQELVNIVSETVLKYQTLEKRLAKSELRNQELEAGTEIRNQKIELKVENNLIKILSKPQEENDSLKSFEVELMDTQQKSKSKVNNMNIKGNTKKFDHQSVSKFKNVISNLTKTAYKDNQKSTFDTGNTIIKSQKGESGFQYLFLIMIEYKYQQQQIIIIILENKLILFKLFIVLFKNIHISKMPYQFQLLQ